MSTRNPRILIRVITSKPEIRGTSQGQISLYGSHTNEVKTYTFNMPPPGNKDKWFILSSLDEYLAPFIELQGEPMEASVNLYDDIDEALFLHCNVYYTSYRNFS